MWKIPFFTAFSTIRTDNPSLISHGDSMATNLHNIISITNHSYIVFQRIKECFPFFLRVLILIRRERSLIVLSFYLCHSRSSNIYNLYFTLSFYFCHDKIIKYIFYFIYHFLKFFYHYF